VLGARLRAPSTAASLEGSGTTRNPSSGGLGAGAPREEAA
jgi:hypothetical protein